MFKIVFIISVNTIPALLDIHRLLTNG